MKNIEVLEYGRLDKKTMELITGGVKPGSDCVISGCVAVGGTHYFYGECALYTQCGQGYQNCSSETKYTMCAGGVSESWWYRNSQDSFTIDMPLIIAG